MNINMSVNSNDIKNVKDSVVKKEEDLKLLSKQKQLIDLGEVIQKRKQIETLRLEKKEKVDEYIAQNLNIKIPEDAKNDNYHNMLRNTLDENKDLLEKYKLKNENQLGTFTGVVEKFNEDELKNDLVNLYYGYKLTKLFLKLKEKDLEISKKSEKDIQEEYDSLVEESTKIEDENDKSFNQIENLTMLLVGLVFSHILSSLILLYYVYNGPDLMHSNFNMVYGFLEGQFINLISIINSSFDIILHLVIFGIPNVYKLIISAIGYYFYKNYEVSKNVMNKFLVLLGNIFRKISLNEFYTAILARVRKFEYLKNK